MLTVTFGRVEGGVLGRGATTSIGLLLLSGRNDSDQEEVKQCMAYSWTRARGHSVRLIDQALGKKSMGPRVTGLVHKPGMVSRPQWRGIDSRGQVSTIAYFW